ncbi:TldD/PmbA family protein [Actinospica durhamensis]|uniref:TldD/PmbA family protein n=1 Tax=Actinospica durhamensis TaxID=1508375 RepID=A0A941IUM8_9ACTN|nr:TldD/PmbA family protein [Actinospica durhamensis]MBR7837733.1 TldD/PmbA family protein [Actinospica durhamensis]
MPSLDPTFAALPLRELAQAALDRARELGVDHADLRSERIRQQSIRLRDAELDGVNETVDSGLAVRVVHRGTWGFAAGTVQTPEAAVRLVEQAVRVAEVSAPVNQEPVILAPEPSHGERTWISSYELDPFEVPDTEKIGLLTDWSRRLLAADAVAHVDAFVYAVKENKFYADTHGTVTTQQRVRLHAALEAVAVDESTGAFETMRTLAPPVGRGWEFMRGVGWDWDAELAALPALLAEKLAAPSIEAGVYDVVVDPSNLWLTIHESIGHATELDRALGYEAAYAGTSFATLDKLDTLKYGSPVMRVTGDRTVEHGLSTVGFDDEGVETQQWDLITGGILTGYQLDRRIAQLKGLNEGRSNGCAFADSPGHAPIQRMANVSLQPAADGPSTAELIAQVKDGLYILGDKSWSIDMQRYNFQFTGQRAFRIKDGKLAGQVKDFAYQATTTDFWGSMEAVGGPETYVLGGAFNCGKGQPGQVAPVSHGCPSALFRGVRILNTVQEAGK